MPDTPKFTVVDRRKFRAEEDSAPTPEPAPEPAPAPRLTLVETPAPVAVQDQDPYESEQYTEADAALEEALSGGFEEAQLPPAPSAEEARFQQTAYEQAAGRLDDLIRAQNPGIPAPEKIGFEHLVQQLYLSAMMQMGAGTPEGQRPRIDILGARQTIDLLGVVAAKTTGSLSPLEDRTLQTVLFELRATFLELTRMISAQPQPPLPPAPGSPAGFGAKR
jgi:hypothetical protein